MANTSSRTLRLIGLLQSRRTWAGPDLAARLEVSVRTLRRDVERLRDLGYPVEADRGSAGGYRLAAGAALPPLVLDDEEAVALAVGLQAAAGSAVEGMAEASVRALATVTQVLPARLRRRVEALGAATVASSWASRGPTVSPAVLTTLATACRGPERVRFAYTSASGASSARHAEPYRLVPLGRRWYLVAYDLDRGDWRRFRLDRLTAPEPTGVPFRPRELPAADAAAYVRAGVEGLPEPYAVEALVEAPADDVRARIGRWSTVEPVAARRCRVRMTADELAWPVMALGETGAEFTVVAPEELRALLRDLAGRYGRASSSAAVTP